MITWRKPAINSLLHLTGSDIPENLRTIRRLWRSKPEAVERYQRRNLAALLKHAHRTVPYYNDVLEEARVVVDGATYLENFDDIPILTKETLREEKDRLVSSDPGRETYTNTSGGTTGEPVELVQDKHYWEWNVATKIFYQELAGKPLGGKEIKLWGNERDLRTDGLSFKSLKVRARNFLYNRRLLNSYRMGEEDMREHIETVNSFRPRTIWAYVESIYQLSLFVERNGLNVHSPAGILTTAGTLHEPVRERIERAFETQVYNQYGSREVGDMACECSAQDGIHVFPYAHHLQIVDETGDPLPPGKNGRIAVTALNNYSMPLIRYEIGDMGILSAEGCRCGHPFPTLDRITGRVTDHFRSTNGDLVHPGYLRKSLYYRDWIEKFQIRQTDTEHVKYVIKRRTDTEPPKSDLEEIRNATRTVLGDEVEISFDYPDAIVESESGKYRYTVSEVVE